MPAPSAAVMSPSLEIGPVSPQNIAPAPNAITINGATEFPAYNAETPPKAHITALIRRVGLILLS